MCPPMLIEEYIDNHGDFDEEEEPRDETNMEQEENAQLEGAESMEHQGNASEEENGTSKKRTRGPTQCMKIHSRSVQDREEVVLDDDGEPIGPSDKTVSDLSYFLGTIARNGDFCPLIYTNFKVLMKNHSNDIWDYVNEKYNILDKGKKLCFLV